jgi:glycosyltransferase involved in cell wall biosynthesis
MRAMAKFNNSQKSWRLLFVGNDRYGLLSEYKGFLCSERIRDKVQFHATHDRAKIREMLINSDVFVLTSLSEGLPNAPLEAMSVGIPCILTNVGGCGEIVRDGFNGFLVEPGDYEALSSRLLVLCNSRALLTRMGNRARKRVLATYSLDVCADNYMRVFQMLELKKSQ